MSRSELVDEMIARTPDWRGEIVARLREIIHAADPNKAVRAAARGGKA